MKREFLKKDEILLLEDLGFDTSNTLFFPSGIDKCIDFEDLLEMSFLVLKKYNYKSIKIEFIEERNIWISSFYSDYSMYNEDASKLYSLYYLIIGVFHHVR